MMYTALYIHLKWLVLYYYQAWNDLCIIARNNYTTYNLLFLSFLLSLRALNLFLEELFASKVMIPTMNYVSTPVSEFNTSAGYHFTHLPSFLQDFLNKILILIFDKESVSNCKTLINCACCIIKFLYWLETCSHDWTSVWDGSISTILCHTKEAQQIASQYCCC